MTPPPLPPGVEGHPVAPDVHTGCAEPDRDGWTDNEQDHYSAAADSYQSSYRIGADHGTSLDLAIDVARKPLLAEIERLRGDRRALDIAVTGLRELETRFADRRDEAGDRMDDSGHHIAEAYDSALCDVSALLDKIGATR